MNKIKLLSASIFLVFCFSCSGMGGKRPAWQTEQERTFDNKIFWACTDKQTPQPDGLWCNQTCAKKSGDKCLEIKINILDVKKDHNVMLKGGWVLAPSKIILN